MYREVSISPNGVVKLEGRQIATLRGKTLDVRRHNSGFVHSARAVGINQELLGLLDEDVIVQITNTDTGETWTAPVSRFKTIGVPFRVSGYETQRALPLADMQRGG